MKRYAFFIFITLTILKSSAQDPSWTFNSANYQYSMTFTAFLSVNDVTLSNSEDKVAAFVGGEIRGVSQVQYIASKAKYLVYLTVYSNTNGEILNFKMFNSTTNSVVDAAETTSFVIDGNVGGVFQSYSIANPTLSDEAVLNAFDFLGITTVTQTISDNVVDIVLPSNTDVTNLIAVYEISYGAHFFVTELKQVSGTSSQDFTQSVFFSLLSQNEATLVQYEIVVRLESAQIEEPTLLLSSNSGAFVNTAPVTINMESNVAITDFLLKDIKLNNAIALPISSTDDLNYSFQIMPLQQGFFSVFVAENSVFNAQNKGNLSSNTLEFTYDVVNPYVVSITRKDPTAEITNNSPLTFTVIFSEAVDNVASTDFEGMSGFTPTLIKENDTEFSITLNTNDSSFLGAVFLNIIPTNSIQDKSGNLLSNSRRNVYQN